MNRPRTIQEWIHWLEAGRGARVVKLAALLLGTLALSLLVAWKQFHGPVSEGTLRQADLARQLARGEGFTTLINYPQVHAVLDARGGGFSVELGQWRVYANRLRELVDTLRGKYDKIIFDSPPIIGVSDAAVLASVVDGAVLLIQHRRNPQSMVVRAQQVIESIKTPLLGVVLNQVPSGTGEDYSYYTHNYSHYSEGDRSRRRSSGKTKSAAPEGDHLDLHEPDGKA
ncbi:MAG: hypothetical protein RIS54_607 [Verrucomicrobiota bacterium]|jgi:hypothetical protein